MKVTLEPNELGFCDGVTAVVVPFLMIVMDPGVLNVA